MNIRPRKYQIGGVSPGGTKKTGILSFDPNGNNIYFNGDWNNYDTWHGSNIIIPWLNEYLNPGDVDWEQTILKGMDSWNDAGGFDWYNATPELRQHRMHSTGTQTHQQYIIDNLSGINTLIGRHTNMYNVPKVPITADKFENGVLQGRNGQLTDLDFGVQTGNRRPTIHINTDSQTTLLWDNYYKNLGYVGKYRYLDHWVPTKDASKAEVKFGESPSLNTPENPNPELPGNPNPNEENPEVNPEENPEGPEGDRIPAYWKEWVKKHPELGRILPPAINIGRLWNTLQTNARVYKHMKKAIFPVLLKSYNTHRQVVGDEATKQAYYTRAAQGQTKAARPFTADADRQVAYLMEAKAVGDQLRAEGDLADNKEIRRTSDESMQHVWQNIARDTEVANLNIVSIAKAKAARHQLDAQEASARGTSWDNWLKEIQTNIARRNQEEKDYHNQLDLYDFILNANSNYKVKSALADYQNAETEYETARIKYTSASTEEAKLAAYLLMNNAQKKVLEKLEALTRARLEYRRDWTQAHPPRYSTWFWGKSGGKFSSDADILYKVSRDAVRHFREMSKQTDNSRIKTLPKAIKLKDPPKSRRYQYGGQAPFMVYTPLALGGGEGTITSASGSTKSSGNGSGDKKKHDTFDVIQDLFKQIVGKGLPSDVNVAYEQILSMLRHVLSYGGEIDSDDLASLYLKQMLTISNLQHEKAMFDDTYKRVDANKGLEELAVDTYGRLVVQTKDGKIERKTLLEVREGKGKYNPLTNDLILQMRAYNKAFDSSLIQIANNGVGLEKIAEYIRTNIGTLGTTEFLQEGYSRREAQKLISGIDAILKLAKATQGAGDGIFKETILTESLKEQAEHALHWVYNMLPNNMKTVLSIHGNPLELISDIISGRMSSTTHYSIDAILGEASGKTGKTGKTSSDEDGDSNNSAALAFILGQGPREKFSFNIGNSEAVTVNAIRGTLLFTNNENLSQGSTLQDVSKSQFGGFLKLGKATFGGSRLNDLAYDHIILKDSTIMGMDLPVTTDIHGNIVPDFLLTQKMELAELEIQENNIQDVQKINQIYLKNGLPPKYKADGTLNEVNYKRFATIQAVLDETALENKAAILADEVQIAEGSDRELYEKAVLKSSGDSKFSLSDGWPLTHWGRENVLKGTIFIPYDEDVAFAAVSSGKPFKQGLPNNSGMIQTMLYAPLALSYKAPDDEQKSQIKQ